jgi:hypothetical protein
MKRAFLYLFLPFVLGCCVEPTFFPREVVSAEYVSEDCCKIGYRGDLSQYTSYKSKSKSGGDVFFMELIAKNSDRSNFYSCREFEWIDKFFNWSWTKTYYVLWYADINWDRGKTVVFNSRAIIGETGFQVP